VRPRRTVQKHGLRARNGHVKRANIGLVVLKWDVAGVYAAVHGRAGCICSGLGHGVVAVRELELHYVADRGGDAVGNEGVLGATDDYRDYLVGAAEGVCFGGISMGMTEEL
jgi:hypothetical protein